MNYNSNEACGDSCIKPAREETLTVLLEESEKKLYMINECIDAIEVKLAGPADQEENGPCSNNLGAIALARSNNRKLAEVYNKLSVIIERL